MTLSSEATKYRDDFAKVMHSVAERVATKDYRNDLELIKEINRGIEEIKTVREKHVRA